MATGYPTADRTPLPPIPVPPGVTATPTPPSTPAMPGGNMAIPMPTPAVPGGNMWPSAGQMPTTPYPWVPQAQELLRRGLADPKGLGAAIIQAWQGAGLPPPSMATVQQFLTNPASFSNPDVLRYAIPLQGLATGQGLWPAMSRPPTSSPPAQRPPDLGPTTGPMLGTPPAGPYATANQGFPPNTGVTRMGPITGTPRPGSPTGIGPSAANPYLVPGSRADAKFPWWGSQPRTTSGLTPAQGTRAGAGGLAGYTPPAPPAPPAVPVGNPYDPTKKMKK